MSRRWVALVATPALLVVWLLTAAAHTSQSSVPQRIVSMVPAITEMLVAIGAGPQIAAVSSFDRAQAVAGLPRVGALLDPDLERVLSLRPDLVIMYASQVEQQDQLRRAGIPVWPYRHGGMADILTTLRELGARTGRTAAAEDLATTIANELADIRARVGRRPAPRTMLVFGREPDTIRNVYASGGIGFLHDMLEAAGGANVFADIRREAAHPSSETILSAAPDVIIELRAVDATEHAITRGTRAWESFTTVPAVRQGRVHVLTGAELVVPGPRVAEVTRRLAALLHPDAF